MILNKKVDTEFLVLIPFYKKKKNTRMLKYIEVQGATTSTPKTKSNKKNIRSNKKWDSFEKAKLGMEKIVYQVCSSRTCRTVYESS